MNPRGRYLLMAILLCACSRSGNKTEKLASRGSAVLATAPAAATKPASGSASAAVDAGKEAPKIVEQEELKTEEREANPYSESVTLKLNVVTRANALVLWGGKQMAHLEPGKMDAEITRPRGSGPLDLEIKAEGFMPYHTRLYADRNDKLSVRLYRPEEASGLFGYKRSAEGKKAEAEGKKSGAEEQRVDTENQR
jgi:hypothetical protein